MRDFSPAEGVVKRMKGLNELNDTAVIRFAEAKRFDEVAASLAILNNSAPTDMMARLLEGLRTDLILIPCSSISHVLSLEHQLAVWKTCYDNLRPGGRFLVEINMPNMASFSDSFGVPLRTPVEIDIDNVSESDGTRLIRRKTTRYLSHEQLAQIRFMYEKYQDGRGIETYIDDFMSHVFFPRELSLLFLYTGYEIEQTFGDYRGRPLKSDSPLIIMIGRRKD